MTYPRRLIAEIDEELQEFKNANASKQEVNNTS